jgi:hypothetical protein
MSISVPCTTAAAQAVVPHHGCRISLSFLGADVGCAALRDFRYAQSFSAASPLKQMSFPFYAKAPAAQAQRNLFMKFIVFFLGWVAIIACATIFENWFSKHEFIGAVGLLAAIGCLFTFVLAWRHTVSCPRCGWNINLKKTKFGSPGNQYFLIPTSCPNCGASLDIASCP